MTRITISLLDRNEIYLELLSSVLGVSKSQIVSDMIDYIREKYLPDIWENWEEKRDSYKEFAQEEVDTRRSVLKVEDLDKEEEEEEEE